MAEARGGRRAVFSSLAPSPALLFSLLFFMDASPALVAADTPMLWVNLTRTPPPNLFAPGTCVVNNVAYLFNGSTLYTLSDPQGSWSKIQNYNGPSFSQEAPLVSDGTYLYTYGFSMNNVWLYMFDIATSFWSSYDYANVFAPLVTDFGLACLNNSIYLFGGSDGNGDQPSTRYSSQMVAIGGLLYMYGGHDGSNSYDDVYTFNPLSNVWTLLSATGSRPTGGGRYFSMTNIGSMMYIFGGENSNNDVNSFDTTTKKWTLLSTTGSKPVTRMSAAFFPLSTNSSTQLVVHGGESATVINDILRWTLDTKTLVWTVKDETVLSYRYGCAMSSVSKLYLVSGYGTGAKLEKNSGMKRSMRSRDLLIVGNSNNPYIYTPSTDSWMVKEFGNPFLVADERYGAAMVSVGTKTYLHGGYSSLQTSQGYNMNILLGQMTIFDTVSETWSHVYYTEADYSSTYPSKRYGHAMAVNSTTIFLFGGFLYNSSICELLQL
eukprot:765761-Hanusia_phi.AAC.2